MRILLIYKLSGPVLSAAFIALLLLFAGSSVPAQDQHLDFNGAATCSCYIRATTDNQGKLNGYVVRLDIQYQENSKPRWNHPMRMYRVEDRKKAGQFCVSIYKQYFKMEQKQYEALQKEAHREGGSRLIPQVATKNSLASAF